MNATTQQEDRLVSIRHIANRLSLSIRGVYRLIARDEFPRPVKVGGATRFYESDLESYLHRLREGRNAG